MSTKCRLPTKDNHEFHVNGLEYGFEYGLNVDVPSMKFEKLYMSLQYGYMDLDNANKENVDKATIDFDLLARWTERVTKDQIELMKNEQTR